MKKYTVRVELHAARAEDYAELHNEMNKKGFSKTLEIKGFLVHLPSAEYN